METDHRSHSDWSRKTYGELLTEQQQADYAAAVAALVKLTRRQLQKLKADVIPQIQRTIPPETQEEVRSEQSH